MGHHLAQINISRLLAPLDDPKIAEFVAQLEPINALADKAPGFVWRLKSESGNATDIAYNDDPFVIVNMSVWESIEALRNFALRSGVEDVDTLVAMLIQSERFGTSMGLSLRVHSDTLRAKRQMLAEDAAAKIALKLLFPLIFFIFPTLLIVLVGPAGIQVAAALSAMSAN